MKPIESTEGQKTVDDETGLSLGEVLIQAEEQGVDIQGLDQGESVTFTAKAPMTRAARASQDGYYYPGIVVLLCRLWTWFLFDLSIYCVFWKCNGNSILRTASLNRDREAAHIRSQSWKGIRNWQRSAITEQKRQDRHISLIITIRIFPAGKRFIVTHLAASYANGSSDAFYGTNSTGEALAMELYHYAVSQPDIPDVEMSFSQCGSDRICRW